MLIICVVAPFRKTAVMCSGVDEPSLKLWYRSELKLTRNSWLPLCGIASFVVVYICLQQSPLVSMDYRVNAWTGWPGIRKLWLGEIASLICNFYLGWQQVQWSKQIHLQDTVYILFVRLSTKPKTLISMAVERIVILILLKAKWQAHTVYNIILLLQVMIT